MISTDWIVGFPPPQPTVFATIKTNSWQLNAETSSNSSLSVLANSLLLLMCTASYPVKWYDKEGKALRQNRTINSFLEENGEFGVNQYDQYHFADQNGEGGQYGETDSYSITPIARYEAVITFRNLSTADLVMCSSAAPLPQSAFTTSIQVDVHTVKADQSKPRILQAGFEKVRLAPTRFLHWGGRTEISIIYAHLPGASINISVSTPDLGILYPSAQNETPMSKNGVTFETTSIAPGIGQATVIFHGAPYRSWGDYQFAISSRHSNGSDTVAQNFSLLEYLDDSEFDVTASQRLNSNNFSSIISAGSYYLLRLHLLDFPILEKTRLIVEERIPYEHELECRPNLLLPNDAMEKCGVLGFSIFNESAESQVGVQIFLRATEPCVLTVISSLQGANNTIVKSSLLTTTLDPSIFGTGKNASRAEISTNPPLERSHIAYINETLEINCILPKCHLFWMAWEGDGAIKDYYFPPLFDWALKNYSSPGFFNIGTKMTFSDNATCRVSTLKIPFLQHNQSGQYVCGLFPRSSSNQTISREVAINVTVKDPVEPYFLDGKQFDVEDVTLPKEGAVNLLCNVTGDPEPKIEWYLGQTTGTTNSSIVFPETGSTFQVNQPSIYICIASNKLGHNNRTYKVHNAQELRVPAYVPYATAIPSTVILVCFLIVLYCWLRCRALHASLRELSNLLKNPPTPIPIDDTAPLNDQAQFIPYNRRLEITRDSFTVTSKTLGKGAYGYIFKGELKMDGHSDARLVAVKVPRDPRNLQHFGALVDEMKVMCQIRPHVNVLALAGACTDHIDKKQLFVLTEFCENGSLKDYLTQNRMKFEGCSVNGQFASESGAVEALLKYAYQVANGMTHLAAERIIHRDLALRNLLLTANHIVKIADFGMSRQRTSNLYRPKLSKDVPVPLFWMAPEAIFCQKYTQKSDVWSVGIVLWEMFSCGRRPYPDHCPDSAFCIWLKEKEENRLAPPNIACAEMYDLMRHCWKTNPHDRPTFSECKRIIARTLEQKSPSMYQSILLSLSEAWLSISTENSTSTNADEDDPFSKGALRIVPEIRQPSEKEIVNALYIMGIPHSADSTNQKSYSQKHDTLSICNMDNSDSGFKSYKKEVALPYAASNNSLCSASSSIMTDI